MKGDVTGSVTSNANKEPILLKAVITKTHNTLNVEPNKGFTMHLAHLIPKCNTKMLWMGTSTITRYQPTS